MSESRLNMYVHSWIICMIHVFVENGWKNEKQNMVKSYTISIVIVIVIVKVEYSTCMIETWDENVPY